jgi:GDP-L-fucose synthase|tara:strand:+ start:252 stop:1184 length:933 start_codon:yes stop_codon:yes gene_type:complete
MKRNSRIFVAGENTMEGKALIRLLKKSHYSSIINLENGEPDLSDYSMLTEYFQETQPQYVFLLAGKSGGIKANQDMPATFMLDNLQILCNVVHLAHIFEVEKLLFMASSCSYPKHADQPMRPEMLMSGSLEPTNSAYATAKLAGIELCQAFRKEHVNNFITVIPANVFGPGDDFSIDNSHVVASLIRRMDDAIKSGSKSVNVWGSGKPKREFIFVNDLADACIFLMKHYEENSPINVGTGTTLSVRKLAYLIMDIVGYNGKIEFDTRKPDGMPIKVLDSDRLFELGWIPSTTIHSALDKTYHWFKSVQSP